MSFKLLIITTLYDGRKNGQVDARGDAINQMLSTVVATFDKVEEAIAAESILTEDSGILNDISLASTSIRVIRLWGEAR